MKKSIGLKFEELLIEQMDTEAELLHTSRTEFVTRAVVELIEKRKNERAKGLWNMTPEETAKMLEISAKVKLDPSKPTALDSIMASVKK